MIGTATPVFLAVDGMRWVQPSPKIWQEIFESLGLLDRDGFVSSIRGCSPWF